jgi:enoyl-CoA hydratase/carnithine racemase
MNYDDYNCLSVGRADGVATVTIDHAPINLLDLDLLLELDRLSRQLETDADVSVVVVQSADPEFFIAHADVTLIERMPSDDLDRPTELPLFHQMVERFRTMPKVTIGKIEGIARGGGSEFLLSLDMRFAAAGKAVLAQPEVALGILPGGSGTQRLPRLLGRSRALEVILGCEDFTAELAERYGYVNRALPAEEIGAFVSNLATRIASFPAEAIALAKQAAAAAEPDPREGLLEEAWCFNRTLATEAARRRMRAFMEAGGQTREVERSITGLFDLLGK